MFYLLMRDIQLQLSEERGSLLWLNLNLKICMYGR